MSTESTTLPISSETTTTTRSTETTLADDNQFNSVLLLSTFGDNKPYVLKDVLNNGGQLVETNVEFSSGKLIKIRQILFIWQRHWGLWFVFRSTQGPVLDHRWIPTTSTSQCIERLLASACENSSFWFFIRWLSTSKGFNDLGFS